MKTVRIAIGADHRGFEQKEYLKHAGMLSGCTINWLDVGTSDHDRTDYPVFAERVCRALLDGQADRGILLCGTGVGMAIAANRFTKIYAALVWNETVARLSREDDNANVLVFPSDFITAEHAVAMTTVWLNATFQGGRYQERIAMLDRLG